MPDSNYKGWLLSLMLLFYFLLPIGCGKKDSSSGREESEELKKVKREKDLVESATLPFLVALKAKDFDKAIQETDLPFLAGYTGEQRRVESLDDLRKELKQFVDTWEQTEEFPTDVFEAQLWEPGMFATPQKKYFDAMKGATGPDGFFVALGTKKPEGGLHMSGKRALVKISHGKAKVVGLFSH